jgi:hypothetical protein
MSATPSSKPIDELVEALFRSTQQGKTEWEQVDAQGRVFLATRASGSVLLKGAADDPFGGPSVTLEVKDADGQAIETAEAGTSMAALMGQSTPGLAKLYSLVRERHSRTGETLRSLAREFGN